MEEWKEYKTGELCREPSLRGGDQEAVEWYWF